MNLFGVNANMLVALDVLLRERSVTRAAQIMGLSQPAMSNNLTRLRELFDDPLLVRVGNGMACTPRAEALAEPVRAAVLSMEAVLRPPERFDPSRCEAKFRVVMSDLGELVLLPPLLERLSALAPRASLQVFSGGLFEVPEGLASGALDAMIGYYASAELGPGYREARLFKDELVCIARRGHPRVKGGKMSKRDYLASAHVVVTQRPDAGGIVDDFLAEDGQTRHIGARVPRSAMVPLLVAQTDLVAVLDSPIAERFAKWLPIQRVRVSVRLPKGRMGMLWHERTHHDPERAFLRTLVKEASAEFERAR